MNSEITTPASAVADDSEVPINFTDSAAAKVADLIAEEGNPDLKLRVFVQGGGCCGFQYGFTFDQNEGELYLVHPDFPPQKVTRVSDTNWIINELEFTFDRSVSEGNRLSALIDRAVAEDRAHHEDGD